MAKKTVNSECKLYKGKRTTNEELTENQIREQVYTNTVLKP